MEEVSITYDYLEQLCESSSVTIDWVFKALLENGGTIMKTISRGLKVEARAAPCIVPHETTIASMKKETACMICPAGPMNFS